MEKIKKKLTEKQKRFVAEYPKDCNATQAFLRAGFSPKHANVSASQLLAKPYIKEIVQEKLQSLNEKAGINAEYVLTSLKNVSEVCQRETAFDSSGANKSLELIGKHLRLFGDEKTINLNFVIDFSTKVVEVLQKTLPDKCPHCKNLLELKSETVKALEILSQEIK